MDPKFFRKYADLINEAEQEVADSPTSELPSSRPGRSGKYNQIIWSIQKLGLGRQAFLK
jgi:hypothetical protein